MKLAVELFDGSQSALARAVGIAQQNMNRAIRRGYVSPRVALGIHRATRGKVPANWLRPDIWKRRSHVPREGRQQRW